jgi:DNA (cytosine-5)-methyltransferase 1
MLGEVLPWVSMAEALGWGMTERPSVSVASGGQKRRGAKPLGAGSGSQRTIDAERDAGAWAYKLARGEGITERHGDRPAQPISQPGRHDPEKSGSQQKNAVRVTVQEAAILQSFRPDYPWHGSKSKQYQQVGNAIPPLLARAILSELIDPASKQKAA